MPSSQTDSADASVQLCRLSLKRYGFEVGASFGSDPELAEIVEVAKTIARSNYAAIHILTETQVLPIAATAGRALSAVARLDSVCHRVADLVFDGGSSVVVAIADVRADPLFAGCPQVEVEGIRSYCAAPLIGREGTLLGALCTWSDRVQLASSAARSMLEELAARAMDVLDRRRDHPATKEVADCKPPVDGWTIDAVIDDQAVRTAFQPIVHLASGEVVGFEALSTGPNGSVFALPEDLLAAAARAGRLGELDWLLRTHAMHAATVSGLPAGLSWFFNVEPAGLDVPCPEHLVPALAQARSSLRVVLEMVERDVENHLGKLLHATAQARANAWGVALDDVGQRDCSLPILSVLQPDVVKLDMSLVHGTDRLAASRIMAAVMSYAEQHGAVVVAEGIETEEQERLARLLGAEFGQGYRYGRPGSLPESLPAPREVIPLRQRPLLLSRSPYHRLSRNRPVGRASRAELLRVSDYLEQRAADDPDRGLLLVGCQHAGHLSDRKMEEYRALAGCNALTLIVGHGLREDDEAGLRTVRLEAGSQLGHQWVVVFLTPHYAAALAAYDQGGTAEDLGHLYDYVYTHDRGLVVDAARSLLCGTEPEPAFAWLGDLEGTVEPPVRAAELPAPRRSGRSGVLTRLRGGRH